MQQRIRGAEELAAKPVVGTTELMPDSFVQACSEFESLQAMLDAGGIQEQADFESPAWNAFVAEHTPYDDWEVMKAAGRAAYYRRTLNG